VCKGRKRCVKDDLNGVVKQIVIQTKGFEFEFLQLFCLFFNMFILMKIFKKRKIRLLVRSFDVVSGLRVITDI
jgi:hypothetical protein